MTCVEDEPGKDSAETRNLSQLDSIKMLTDSTKGSTK